MQPQAPRGSASSPALTGVPPELFELIASHIDEAELRALRLTCHTSAANARAHFSSRTILLCDQESIENAIRAAKHPQYGRYFSGLVIYVDKVSDRARALLWGPDRLTSPYVSRRTAAKANLQGCREALEHLFQVVQQRGVGLRLELCDRAADRSEDFSNLGIWEKQRQDCLRATAHNDTKPLELILAALYKSKVEVHDFAVRANLWFPLCCFASLASSGKLPLFSGLMSHVRRLGVSMQLFSTDLDHSKHAVSGVAALRDMVAKAPHLRSLRLQFGEPGVFSAISRVEFTMGTGLPSLHHLSLTSMGLFMADVQTFVLRSPSLRTLDLKDVDFMYGSFSADELSEFEFRDSTDIHNLVRKAIGLSGNYDNIWSDDVEMME